MANGQTDTMVKCWVVVLGMVLKYAQVDVEPLVELEEEDELFLMNML